MRLLHPTTLKIASERDDIPKTVISHVWSEIFKWYGSGQSHPKMFIDDDYMVGVYMFLVKIYGYRKGCNLDADKIKKLPKETQKAFNIYDRINKSCVIHLDDDTFINYFDDNYLFSDACSLYFKGINIFPDIFGDDWRKYVPVESHKEIKRQINKTLNKYESK